MDQIIYFQLLQVRIFISKNCKTSPSESEWSSPKWGFYLLSWPLVSLSHEVYQLSWLTEADPWNVSVMIGSGGSMECVSYHDWQWRIRGMCQLCMIGRGGSKDFDKIFQTGYREGDYLLMLIFAHVLHETNEFFQQRGDNHRAPTLDSPLHWIAFMRNTM